MARHNKITFVREYCLARRIPYKIKNESLYINGHFILYSVYNLPWLELMQIIDNAVVYDDYGYYKRMI